MAPHRSVSSATSRECCCSTIPRWGHCSTGPCGFTVPDEHRVRLDEQADRLYCDHRSRSDLALDIDRTYATVGLYGTTPSIALWMPLCGSHPGAYNDDQFLVTTITDGSGTRSMADVTVEFMAMDRLGRQIMYRHGFVDPTGFHSETDCP